jgi:anti-sigma factor RsiW
MTGSRQNLSMDSKLISERHVIERYLAGQLGDDEADAFEVYLESHPQLAQEVERIARMKTGFAVLERRGELDALLQETAAPRSRRTAWMAAAAVAVVALGFIAFRQATDADARAMRLASTLQTLSLPSESPVPLRASVSISRARGMGADVEVTSSGTAQGAAELEFATGGPPGGPYIAELIAANDAGTKPLARVADAVANADGVVRLYLSLHALEPGAYLLRFTPPGGADPIEYSLRVR